MRIVSGIRPTGNIHLGNYLGAVRSWRTAPADAVLFVADLHSDEDGSGTQDALRRIGIDTVLESDHAAGILKLQHRIAKYVGVGRLERMTQYKDKSETEQATLSLLSYPVLMTSDILYFGGTHVPVGNDQLQHIEFARDVVDILAFHGYDYEKPEAVVSEYPRIMSLKDGTKKMSKSDPDDDSRININDSPDDIRRKIMNAKTSMHINDDSPEMVNLRKIYRAVGGVENHTRFKDFKEELAELIIRELAT